MPLFLLANWKYAIIALLLFACGVQTVRLANLKTSIAEQKADAAATLADVTAKAAAADARNAELANKLDAQHAKALSDIDATRADFAGRLRLAASRACRSGPAAAEAAHPGSGAGIATGGDDGPGSLDLEAGRRLRDYLKQLQAYAQTCHAFAMEIGR